MKLLFKPKFDFHNLNLKFTPENFSFVTSYILNFNVNYTCNYKGN